MVYKVLVIGDSCIDRFQYGKVERICPEAPCPVFVPTYITENDGMAGNVVANLKAFNGNIDIDFITNEEKPIKTRFVEEKSNQMIMRLDEKDHIEEKLDLSVRWNIYDAVIVSDYNKGFLSKEDLIYIAKKHPLTFLDTKRKLGNWSLLFSFIKINKQEYDVSENCIEDNLIVTLGSKGAMYRNIIYPCEKVEVRDVSGAGDTFLAGLVYKYLKTKNIIESIIFANQCAAKVITKRGTSTL